MVKYSILLFIVFGSLFLVYVVWMMKKGIKEYIDEALATLRFFIAHNYENADPQNQLVETED